MFVPKAVTFTKQIIFYFRSKYLLIFIFYNDLVHFSSGMKTQLYNGRKFEMIYSLTLYKQHATHMKLHKLIFHSSYFHLTLFSTAASYATKAAAENRKTPETPRTIFAADMLSTSYRSFLFNNER